MKKKPTPYKNLPQNRDKESYTRDLVIARIKAIPDNMSLIVGSGENRYSKEEIIENIRDGSELGKEVVDTQIEFLKEMAKGNFYQSE